MIPVTDTAVLCYILRKNSEGETEVCLGKHLKHQKWNGFGGKVGDKVEFIKESVEEAVIREGLEEFNIQVQNLHKKGEISFIFPEKTQHTVCHIYTTYNWVDTNGVHSDQIVTNNEISNPTWYKISDIPWDEMWDDDKEWLERLLTSSHFIKLQYIFDGNNRVVKVLN